MKRLLCALLFALIFAPLTAPAQPSAHVTTGISMTTHRTTPALQAGIAYMTGDVLGSISFHRSGISTMAGTPVGSYQNADGIVAFSVGQIERDARRLWDTSPVPQKTVAGPALGVRITTSPLSTLVMVQHTGTALTSEKRGGLPLIDVDPTRYAQTSIMLGVGVSF